MRRPALGLLTLAAAIGPAAQAVAEPQIARTCNASLVCDGWFTTPVSLRWSFIGTPAAGCADVTLSQDTPGTRQGCIVMDGGETASREVTIKIDQTPPAITAADADRPPDHDGWYSRPVTFTPRAGDATSGLAGCDSVTYGGPDGADAPFVASCRDNAGNQGSRAFSLRFDATPPDPSGAAIRTGDRLVELEWPAVAAAGVVVRSPGIGGSVSTIVHSGPGQHLVDRGVRNGLRYRYVLSLIDQAGNSASTELSAVPGPHLVAPGERAAVDAPPTLRWTPVRGARYYNVQLYRGDHKVLTAWPRRPALRLRETWRFRGRRRALVDGLYRWYVWPGEGSRADNRYGARIGRRSFTLQRAVASPNGRKAATGVVR